MRGLELFIKSARKNSRNCLWKSLSHIPEWLRRNDAIWKCHLKVEILEGSGQIWSSIYFFPPTSPLLEWEQTEARITTAVFFLGRYFSHAVRNTAEMVCRLMNPLASEEVKPGRSQIGVLGNARLNTKRFGGHGLCSLREPSLKIEWQRVDTCGDWTAGNLTELGHRVTKEDKCEEQLDRGSEKAAGGGLMYTYLECWERQCWRNIFNHWFC